MPQGHNSFEDLDKGSDKGGRFRFPDGLPGKLVCEAHDDQFVPGRVSRDLGGGER